MCITAQCSVYAKGWFFLDYARMYDLLMCFLKTGHVARAGWFVRGDRNDRHHWVMLPCHLAVLCFSGATFCFPFQVIKTAMKESILHRRDNPSHYSVSLSLCEMHNKKFLKRGAHKATHV